MVSSSFLLKFYSPYCSFSLFYRHQNCTFFSILVDFSFTLHSYEYICILLCILYISNIFTYFSLGWSIQTTLWYDETVSILSIHKMSYISLDTANYYHWVHPYRYKFIIYKKRITCSYCWCLFYTYVFHSFITFHQFSSVSVFFGSQCLLQRDDIYTILSSWQHI